MASEGDVPANGMNVISMIQNLLMNESSPPQRSVSQASPSNSVSQQQSSNHVKSHVGNNYYSVNEGFRKPLFSNYESDSHFFSTASDVPSNTLNDPSNSSFSDFALNGRSCDDRQVSRAILTGMDANLLNTVSSAQSRSPSSFFGSQTSAGTSFQNAMSLSVQNNVPSSGSPATPNFSQHTFRLLNHASELLGSLNSNRPGLMSSGYPGPVGQRSASAIGECLPGVGGQVFSPVDGMTGYPSNGQVNSLLKNQFLSSQTQRPELQLEKFESQIRMISNEIHSSVQMHMNGLMSRKEHLLQQLETIRQVYLSILQHQSKMNKANFPDVMLFPSISFTKPDQALYKAVTSMGFLTTPAFAPYCSASGDGLDAAVVGQSMSFVIVTKNCFKEELLVGKENIWAKITAFTEASFSGQQESRSGTLDSGFSSISGGDYASRNPFAPNLALPGSSPCLGSPSAIQTGLVEVSCNASVIDHHNGKYTVTYSLPNPHAAPYAHVEIVVLVNGVSMIGCPFKVKVRSQQRQSWQKVLTFGSEGNSIGQFCRPWGVAVAKLPSILPFSEAQTIQDCSVSPDSQGTSSSTGKHSNLSSLSQTSPVSPSSNGTNASQTSPSSQTDGESSSSLSPTNNSTTTGTSSLPGLPSSSNSTNHVHHSNNNTVSGYLVAVADRSNNRVQVFRMDALTSQLNPLFTFGSGPGTVNGQFDRPAGICLNIALGHIVVADKDNHRVQIFDLCGRFLLKFGEKGNRAGQFCYPWDVESCPTSHQLLVSDTRNRRIQLFTPYGQYMSHFSQPLDSPRGVAFFADSKILVSDFNKHRLMVFEKNPAAGMVMNGDHGNNRSSHHHLHVHHHHGSSTAPSTPTPPSNSTTRFIGFGEGSGWGEFLRPQGIAISGHYAFCADSRNNRICLYNLVTQTFEYLNEDLGLDRPSGIAVLDNIMIVVDFGNNRLVVCRR